MTTDPTQVAQNFFNTGYDVVISGIDTTEALTVAGQKKKEGKNVWAVPYDYVGACQSAPDVCLGVPYFNWGPAYMDLMKAAMNQDLEAGVAVARPGLEGYQQPGYQHRRLHGRGWPCRPPPRQELDKFIKDLGSGKSTCSRGR